jgi:hypothetical protein
MLMIEVVVGLYVLSCDGVQRYGLALSTGLNWVGFYLMMETGEITVLYISIFMFLASTWEGNKMVANIPQI